MCHDDVIMVTPNTAICHLFWNFSVNPWTNGKVPCGNRYTHMLDCTTTQQVTWQANLACPCSMVTWANERMPHGSRQKHKDAQQPIFFKKAGLAGTNP
jgi:hypothetical protein